MSEQNRISEVREDANRRLLLTYSRDAVLTAREMAEALQVSVRTLERMDLPTIYLGRRTRRYIYGQVLDALATRAA